MSFHKRSIAASLLCLTACASGMESGDEHDGPHGSGASAISGTTAIDVTALYQTPPYGPVGLVRSAAGTCTGSLIQRDIVLFAAHCTCPVVTCVCNSPAETYPWCTFGSNCTSTPQTFANFSFDLPIATIQPPGGQKTVQFQTFPASFVASRSDVPCGQADVNTTPYKDLAILRLQTPVPSSLATDVLYPHTTADFLDKFNSLGTAFLAPPNYVLGYGRTQADPEPPNGSGFLRIATVTSPVLVQYGTDLTKGLYVGVNTYTTGSAVPWKGDSGGPITYHEQATGRERPFGVLSLMQDYGDGLRAWAPTFDGFAGNELNGMWIDQWLLDADGDGVNDLADNCPPWRCLLNPDKCHNPDQADADQDGVGDACDNCPPSYCSASGRPASDCSNSLQADKDADGWGDMCDSCPSVATPYGQFNDADKDGVGDKCDNCITTSNPLLICTKGSIASCPPGVECLVDPSYTVGVCTDGFTSCRSPGDCTAKCINGLCGGTNPFAQCTSDVQCIGCAFLSGACNDGTGCVTNADCSSGPCNLLGRCASQTDDRDGDGMGDRCDKCPDLSNAGFLANNNADAETRENVAPLPDACEPVPIFVSRVRPEGPDEHVVGRVGFVDSYGIGKPTATTLVSPQTETVGFRHCSCYDPTTGGELSRSNCISSLCPIDQSAYLTPAWKEISVGFKGSLLSPVRGKDFQLDFDATKTCGVSLPNSSESCVVGTLATSTWYVEKDLVGSGLGGQVVPIPQPSGQEPVTLGLLWSRALYVTSAVGARDLGGKLRDNFTYVRTPALAAKKLDPSNVSLAPPNQVGGCPGCGSKYFAVDWYVDPETTALPDNPGFVGTTPWVALPKVGGGFIVSRSPGDGYYDADAVLSAEMSGLLSNSALQWVLPAEPVGTGTSAVIAVVMPRDWTAGASPTRIVRRDGKLSVSSERPRLAADGGTSLAPAAGATAPEAMPAGYESVRGVLSNREGAFYLVGGRLSTGIPAGTWKFDLNSERWSRAFTGRPLHLSDGSPNSLIPDQVQAVAYDSARGLMVVVDRTVVLGAPRARMLLLDRHANRTRELLSLPDRHVYDHLALVAGADGKFTLLATRKNVWEAFRFEVTAAGQLHWLALTGGVGRVMADPFVTSRGVMFSFWRGGAPVLLRDSELAWLPNPLGCRDM